MATFLDIAVYSQKNKDNVLVDIGRCVTFVKTLVNKFNFHSENSELSALNKNITNGMICSKEMIELLKIASDMYFLTDGLFDVTAPLFKFDKVKITDNEVISSKNLKLNLSGIAKGFISYKAMLFLRDAGYNNVMINAGGDISCCGDYNWHISIAHPLQQSSLLELDFLVGDFCIASSCISVDARNNGGMSAVFSRYKPKNIHATVISNNCAISDGLTKIGLIDFELSAKIATKLNIDFITFSNEHCWRQTNNRYLVC
jgi:thiamine biosynthesis lipoprotein